MVGRIITDAQLPSNLTVSLGSTDGGSQPPLNSTATLGSMDRGGTGQWWADEDPRRGGPTNLQLQLQQLSPQVAGFIYTGRQWWEKDSLLWLVGGKRCSTLPGQGCMIGNSCKTWSALWGGEIWQGSAKWLTAMGRSI